MEAALASLRAFKPVDPSSVLSLNGAAADMQLAVLNGNQLFVKYHLEHFTGWAASKPWWTFAMYLLLDWMRRSPLAGPALPPLVMGLTTTDHPGQFGRVSLRDVPVFTYCKRPQQPELFFPSYAWWGWPEAPNVQRWDVQQASLLAASARLHSNRSHRLLGRMRLQNNGLRGEAFDALLRDVPERVDLSEGTSLELEAQAAYRSVLHVPGLGCSAGLASKLSLGGAVVHIEEDGNLMEEFYTAPAASCIEHVPTSPGWLARFVESVRRLTDPAQPQPAEALGECSRAYMRDNVRMEDVYLFMERMLREYGERIMARAVTPQELLDAGFINVTLAGSVFAQFETFRQDHAFFSKWPDWSAMVARDASLG